MRLMEIPRFPRKIKVRDLDNFLRTRLSQTVVMWPEQAIPLLGYMCYPNDPEARAALRRTLRSWQEASEDNPPPIPKKLGRIQHNWLRVADVFHLYSDLIAGRHQARRGGASLGKAITLAAANAQSRGTKAATLWKIWSTYKDVAHLVTAATIICAEVRTKFRGQPGPFGLSINQFVPFQIAMLMPDLVIAVALEFERLGLDVVTHARTEPTLDPETLWRIPPDINVVPLPPPDRENQAAGPRGSQQAARWQSGQSQGPQDYSSFSLTLLAHSFPLDISWTSRRAAKARRNDGACRAAARFQTGDNAMSSKPPLCLPPPASGRKC